MRQKYTKTAMLFTLFAALSILTGLVLIVVSILLGLIPSGIGIIGILLIIACSFACYILFKKNEAQLEMLAHYDAVTRLCNRSFFIELLQQSLIKAKKIPSKLAILHIDLDNFKRINDIYGYQFGDEILKLAAHRLNKLTKKHDLSARLGGDEFAILINNIEHDDIAITVAKRLLYAFEKPLVFDKKSVMVTLSIGIATFPSAGEHVFALMRNADIAMHHAKANRKNTYQYYSDALDKENKRQREIINQLQQALVNNEFYIMYQPQVDTNNQTIMGVEALIRWNNSVLGNISPDEFIPIAEKSGIIYEIGEWVFMQSCRQYIEWRQCYQDLAISININVSALQLTDNHADRLIQKIKAMDIDPKCIVIEVTETALMHNIESAANVLDKFHCLGINIAIDDFGTGYSSFNYLKKLPITTLKIDQIFINDITSDKNAASIVRAIIQLGQSLGLHIVAEGVETKAQFEFLKQHHCDGIQGYYFSKPLHPNDVLSQCKTQT